MAKTRFTSPVGRFVQGSVDEPQTKDAQGQLRVVKSGPNVGQPNPQFFVAVAFPKADPAGEFAAFYGLLVQQAAADFPNLFPQGPGGACVHPQFAFKVIDGDGFDSSGKPNNTKEGFAGHWVVRFASAYPPRCFHAGRYAANEQIQEKNAIKRGYFVRVNGTVEGNANAQRPGIYVNLDMVELAAYGPEIVSGPDAGTAFGGAPATLPPGATAAPVGAPAAPLSNLPATPPAVPLPATPPAVPLPATPPAAGYMAPGAPAAPLAAPVSTAAAPSPPVPPLPSASAAIPSSTSGPVMLPAANGATYQAMLAAGWTDETLRAHGMMQ